MHKFIAQKAKTFEIKNFKKVLTNEGICGIIFIVECRAPTINKNAPLAQLVEQLTLNQWVPGSNP